MPVTTSAKQALRKDRRRTVTNNRVRAQLRSSIKKFQKSPEESLIPELYSIIDRASKKKIIHKNKASRLKAKFSKQTISTPKTKTTTTKKKTPKKAKVKSK